MKAQSFWSWLVFLMLITSAGIVLIHRIDAIAEYYDLSVAGLVFMVLSVVLLFELSKRTVNSKNKYAFIQLVIASVLFKIIVALAIIVAYMKISVPENKYFALPFIGIYLIFSIFETAVLYKVALTNSNDQYEQV